MQVGASLGQLVNRYQTTDDSRPWGCTMSSGTVDSAGLAACCRSSVRPSSVRSLSALWSCWLKTSEEASSHQSPRCNGSWTPPADDDAWQKNIAAC